MLIREMSDIHLEFCPMIVPPMVDDSETTLLLAGDICTAKHLNDWVKEFFESVSKQFKYVIYIPGNHEYYRKSLKTADNKIRELLASYSNVYYLNGESVVLDGVAFIGATLWTDVFKGDPMAIHWIENGMNDYKVIRTGTPANPYLRTLKASDTIGMHIKHKKFIFESIAEHKQAGLKTVVMSHHAPSEFSVSPKYKGDRYNAGYFSNLENEIMDFGSDLWFHGHMHDSFKYGIGITDIMCNPRGYTRLLDIPMFRNLKDGTFPVVDVNDPDSGVIMAKFESIFDCENKNFNPYLQIEI